MTVTPTPRANDNEGAFSIGQNVWPGLAKLAEEAAEVIQIVAKLIATGGRVDHWSGLKLDDELCDELGDLLAAITFVKRHNPVDVGRINRRAAEKVDLFERWHE